MSEREKRQDFWRFWCHLNRIFSKILEEKKHLTILLRDRENQQRISKANKFTYDFNNAAASYVFFFHSNKPNPPRILEEIVFCSTLHFPDPRNLRNSKELASHLYCWFSIGSLPQLLPAFSPLFSLMAGWWEEGWCIATQCSALCIFLPWNTYPVSGLSPRRSRLDPTWNTPISPGLSLRTLDRSGASRLLAPGSPRRSCICRFFRWHGVCKHTLQCKIKKGLLDWGLTMEFAF